MNLEIPDSLSLASKNQPRRRSKKYYLEQEYKKNIDNLKKSRIFADYENFDQTRIIINNHHTIKQL